MNFSTARSERITAMISTAVAVVILAGGVTAYQSHTAPVDDIVQLESDLRFQLEVAFKHDPNERAARLVELSKVSQAWHNSPRSEADREQLARWLLEATIRSMPGSIEPLPVVPSFGEATQVTPPQPLEVRTPNLPVEPPATKERIPSIAEPVAQVPTPVNLVSTEILPINREALLADTEIEGVEFSIQSSIAPFPTPPAKPQSTTVAKVEPIAPVQINLTELAARIAGYHAGLDEIETKLLTLATNDFTSLTKQIRQLDEMTRDFQFVKLYYEALSDKERRAVIAPRPMTVTLAAMERYIDRAQADLSEDFLGDVDSSNQDSLGELRQLLAEVTARVAR